MHIPTEIPNRMSSVGEESQIFRFGRSPSFTSLIENAHGLFVPEHWGD